MSNEIISAIIGGSVAIIVIFLQLLLSKRKESNLKLEIKKILAQGKIKRAQIVLKKEKRYNSDAAISSDVEIDMVEIRMSEINDDLSEKEKGLIKKYCKLISRKI